MSETTIKRRSFLKLAGGGVVLAATGLGAGWGLTRTPTEALSPWSKAGQYDDPRMRALSYAILAPNPHNRQPWVADLAEPGRITLFRDKAKKLPHTDPFDRQLTVGMGCFLELLVIAAGRDGLACDIDLFPQGEAGPVAVIDLNPGGIADPLFAHILNRRSCKEPFTDQMPDATAIAPLRDLGEVITDSAPVARLKDISWRAFVAEYETPHTLQESIDLMRIGKAEINANPDGIDLGGPFLEGMAALGIMNRPDLSDPTTTSYQQGLAMNDVMLNATPAYLMLRTAGNSRRDQIAAGRRWARANLTATAQGLSLHPVSQALQEYPEVRPFYDAIHTEFAAPGETIQMLGRLGYGPETTPSPRWPVSKKVTGTG